MTIDSNIIIAFPKGDASVVSHMSDWKQSGRPLFVSTIAEAEVLGYPEYTAGERDKIARFIGNNFVPIVCDRSIAYRTAVLRSSINIKLPDAIIAAAALSTATPLVTRNVKDFKNVPGLEIISL